MSDEALLLEAVAEVATVAGATALKHFGRAIEVELKGDGSPVTIADRNAEQAARDWLARRFPSDAVLGEEFGESGDARGRKWLIDPIDGTKSFVAGVPLWGTLIAVVEGEQIVAGAINCAAAGEMVTAARGQGAWWNGARCAVSVTTRLSEATLLTTSERFRGRPDRARRWRALAGQTRIVRTWGDCFGYLLVATGRADVMVDDRMNAWDSAALLPIIEEAGGSLTDWRGVRTGFGGDTIATNALLGPSVRTILGENER